MDLSFDTSTNKISFTIGDDKFYKTYTSKSFYKQNLAIIKIFKNILRDLNLKIEDIKNYYFTIGPGSFTGIRTGIGFLLGLTEGRDVKFFPLSTLQAISLSKEGIATAILPQTKKFYYVGIYSIKNSIKKLMPLKIVEFEEIEKIKRGEVINFEELKAPLSEVIFKKRKIIKEKKPPFKPFYMKNPYDIG